MISECRPRGKSARARPVDLRPFAPVFRAVGDETRAEIVALLVAANDGLCACEIEAHFDLAQPTISHHLKVLRKAGWLKSERRGTWIYYSLDRDVLAWFDAFSALVRG